MLVTVNLVKGQMVGRPQAIEENLLLMFFQMDKVSNCALNAFVNICISQGSLEP